MNKNSYTGNTAVFTGRPSIVQGGFTLDSISQTFNEGDIIPAGTLAIYDEQTRKVQIIKTGKVGTLHTQNNSQVIGLVSIFFHQSSFVVGDKILKTVSGLFDNASTITEINKNGTYMRITITPVMADLAVGDTLVQVVDKGGQAALIGDANCVTFKDVEVKGKYTAIDVSADTKDFELYERRVLPIPESQKDETGMFLKANPHIKLTQSY